MNKVKLGDLLEVKRGTTLSSKYYSKTGSRKRLTLGNFNYPNGGFKENMSKEDIFFIGDVKSEYILKKDDIITPLTEQVHGLLGETARIPLDDVYVQSGDIGLVIPNSNKLDNKFAYYLISSPVVKKQLSAGAQQTKIRHTSPDKIKDCQVYLPDLSNQKKIGVLLNNIDHKIKINNKINDELEAMAKTVYDYWFLQFEFPNKEGKPYKSSGGKMVWNEELKREIPEGWEVKHIIDILDNVPNSTKINTKEYLNRGKYPIIDQSSKYICGYTNDDNAVLSLKDAIIFGDHTKCIKYINFEFARGADGTQVILSKERNLSNLLLYYQIKDMHLVNQGYSRYFKFLKEQKIIIPDKYTKELFDNIEVLYKKIRKNLFENQELISLRDFLLPLLMNGQVGFKEDKAEG